MTDLAPDGSRILMPRCGVSYLAIVAAAAEHRTVSAAAVALGVSRVGLKECVDAFGLGHWFQAGKPLRCSLISRRRLLYWIRQGMTRKDISEATGISYVWLNTLLRRHGLAGRLPNKGAASWLARRGYVGSDTVGLTAGKRAWEDPCGVCQTSGRSRVSHVERVPV